MSRAVQVKRALHRIATVKADLRVALCSGELLADAVYLHEGDPRVVSLCEYPLRIHGPIGTRSHITLDLAVTDRSGAETLYTICREADLRPTENGRRLPPDWLETERLARAGGHACVVMTDRDIERHRKRITNWRLLLPLARAAYLVEDPKRAELLLALFDDRARVTLADMPSLVAGASPEEIAQSVARLLHEGTLTADLDTKEFTALTPVQRSDRDA